MPPKKRKAAACAAASASSKKRKSAAAAVHDHSDCKLHTDVDQRKTRCNGFRRDGSRCTTKIRMSVLETAMAEERLPVCGQHNRQKLQVGRCAAIADCGEKCDRLVVLVPLLNQLCKTHEDVSIYRVLLISPEMVDDCPCTVANYAVDCPRLSSHLVANGNSTHDLQSLDPSRQNTSSSVLRLQGCSNSPSSQQTDFSRCHNPLFQEQKACLPHQSL